MEEHGCTEELGDCLWHRCHEIVGFEYDEDELVSPVYLWLLTGPVFFKPDVSDVERVDMHCLEEDFVGDVVLYVCFGEKSDRVVGAYEDDGVRLATAFDIENDLHLYRLWRRLPG